MFNFKLDLVFKQLTLLLTMHNFTPTVEIDLVFY